MGDVQQRTHRAFEHEVDLTQVHIVLLYLDALK